LHNDFFAPVEVKTIVASVLVVVVGGALVILTLTD
jgi:hypothetical protein